MKKFTFFCMLTLLTTVTAFAKYFTGLNSNIPIAIVETADEEGYKTIHLLAVSKSEDYDSIPLRLELIINKDTLVDYIILTEAMNKSIKTFYQYEGDRVQANLFIQDDNSIEIKKIKGNIKFDKPKILKSSVMPKTKSFIGNYWDVKQTTMFRINKFDSIPKTTRLTIEFDHNFAYDKFYFQINVLSPDSSFDSFEGKVSVNKGDTLKLNTSYIDLTEEIGIIQNGKYTIDIVPLMGMQRINGIKSIGYKLVSVTD